MSTKRLSCMILGAAAAALISGCSSISKGVPIADTSIDLGSMKRGDYEVLDRVTGESESDFYLCGLVQKNDGKWKVLGLHFYTEKVSLYESGLLEFLGTPSNPVNRAYYNALAKTPDADTVVRKSVNIERWGIPCIFSTERVTFEGKAIKLKSDKEVR